MKPLISYLVANLVDNPEQMKIVEKNDGFRTQIQIHVAPEDRGKIIGKKGRVIRSIRTVVNASKSRQNKRVMIELLDEVTGNEN